MKTERKPFEDRKNTIGVSLSNRTLISLEEYCRHVGISRSLLIETILQHLLQDEDELNRILYEVMVHYERD